MTALEQLLIQEEGFCSYAYKDSEGFWTIGYGKLIDKRGGGITEDEALVLLRNEIYRVTMKLYAVLPWINSLNDTRRVVLQAMAYQLGTQGLLKFKNTLAAVKRGDYAAAAQGMRNSLWYKQTPARAERMAKAMESGVLYET